MFKNEKILIVDDDPVNIFSLSAALEMEDLEVYSCEGGAQALQLIEEHGSFDVVLMDIQMPGMNGYEAMERIRNNPKSEDLFVVALTAKAMKGDKEKCLDAGASDYCSKPIDLDELTRIMLEGINEQKLKKIS